MMTKVENGTKTATAIRPFQNADAKAVAGLVTAGVRGHWQYQPEQFRESPDPRKIRLVAEQKGRVSATAKLAPFGDGAPDALRLDLAGDGAAFTPLYLRLLAELPVGFTRLLGVTREDFSEQMGFFAAAGFRNGWQSWGAHLDTASFDFEPYRPLEKKLYLAGYELEPLGQSKADWNAFYKLHQAGENDVPRNPVTMPKQLSSAALKNLVKGGEQVFIARYRGEIVALTRLSLHGPEVESEFTTTQRGHRGQGVATLLKAYALAWAGAQGLTRASTGGTVLNLPMLRVNTRLGYALERLWITWERRLTL